MMNPETSVNRIKLKSYLFDKELIELGNWDEQWKRRFELWNEEYDPNIQKELALELIRDLVLKILNNDFDPRGMVRIRRLGIMFNSLEQLLMSSITLDRKYYRDHLNHSIRVCLLNKVLSNYLPFKIEKNKINFLLLSSIYHDITYPLSQTQKILNSVVKSIKKGYNIASSIRNIYNVKFKIEDDILKMLFEDKTDIIKQGIDSYDHGILSALEFITYLKDNNIIEKYKEVIKDITYHTLNSNDPININNNKTLLMLILSDEIQDWGRPNNYGEISISKIDPFEIRDNNIFCNFVVENFENYSVLRQLYGKTLNLKRISLNELFNLKLTYPLNFYDEYISYDLLQDTQKLFNICLEIEDIFDPSQNKHFYRNNHEAEIIYYGINISSIYKSHLVSKMKNNELNEENDMINTKILLNAFSNESLIIDSKIQVKDRIFIENYKNKIILKFNKDENTNMGYLYGIKDEISKDTLYKWAGIIRIVNACIMKLCIYKERKYPYELGIEEYPDKTCLNKIKSLYNININKYKIRELMNTINTEGSFIFKKEENII